MARVKTYAEAKSAAEALCARSEHCAQDIRRKCFAWGLDEESGERLIKELQKGRYIDHVRYASAFVREKSRLNKWGQVKIAAALRSKGIEEETVKEALEEMPSEAVTEEVLLSLLRTKNRSLHDEDMRRRKEKLLRFAVSRGYAFDLAMRVVEKV